MRGPAIPLEACIRIDNPTPDDIYDPVRFKVLVRQTIEEARARDMVQVRALLQAGWKLELPEGDYDYEPYQWQWRAPAKRANSRGRKYLSTNQAFNAMNRVQRKESE